LRDEGGQTSGAGKLGRAKREGSAQINYTTTRGGREMCHGSSQKRKTPRRIPNKKKNYPDYESLFQKGKRTTERKRKNQQARRRENKWREGERGLQKAKERHVSGRVERDCRRREAYIYFSLQRGEKIRDSGGRCPSGQKTPSYVGGGGNRKSRLWRIARVLEDDEARRRKAENDDNTHGR